MNERYCCYTFWKIKCSLNIWAVLITTVLHYLSADTVCRYQTIKGTWDASNMEALKASEREIKEL